MSKSTKDHSPESPLSSKNSSTAGTDRSPSGEMSKPKLPALPGKAACKPVLPSLPSSGKTVGKHHPTSSATKGSKDTVPKPEKHAAPPLPPSSGQPVKIPPSKESISTAAGKPLAGLSSTSSPKVNAEEALRPSKPRFNFPIPPAPVLNERATLDSTHGALKTSIAPSAFAAEPKENSAAPESMEGAMLVTHDETADEVSKTLDSSAEVSDRSLPHFPSVVMRSASESRPGIQRSKSGEISAQADPHIRDDEARSDASNELRLPNSWLEGKPHKPVKRTEFSDPKVLAVLKKEQPRRHSNQNNTGLELNAGLPQELLDTIAAYDDEIENASTRDGQRECTIQLAIARILEYTGYEKLAYIRYLRALDANQFSRTAIHELRRIARAYNKTKDVITLLQSDIDTGINADEQAALLEECSIISFFSETPKPQDAIAMLYRAAALAPKSLSPLCTLFYMLYFSGRMTESCVILEKLLTLTDDKEFKLTCQMFLGDLLCLQEHNSKKGLDAYRQGLELMPGSVYTFGKAMAHLIRQDDWKDIYIHSIHFAEQTKDKITKHAALVFAGSIASDILLDMQSSNRAYADAIRTIPSDTLALELLIENYTNDPTQWKALDQAYAELSRMTSLPKRRMEIALMRAISLDSIGNQSEDAINVLREALETDDAPDRVICEYYRSLLYKTGHIREMMALMQQMAAQVNPEEAAMAFAEIGCYCYDVLKKYEDAETNFRHALEFNPAQRIAFEYMVQILLSRSDYRGLSEIYRARLDVTGDARVRASLLHFLATLCEFGMNQSENAYMYFTLYREIYPDDLFAVHSIERLAAKEGNWKEVIEMLLYEKSTAETPAERANILLCIANICRYKLNKLPYAANYLYLARSETPSSPIVFKALEDVLFREKRWKELIGIYGEHLSHLQKPSDRILVLLNMAYLYEQIVSDSNAAIACYEQILKYDSNNLLALTQLSCIYRRTGNFAAYYELALAQAEEIQVPELRSKYLYRVALKTLTFFQDKQQAILILESALISPPYSPQTIYLLSLLYGASEQYESLITMLREYINSVQSKTTKSDTSLIIANVAHSFMHKPEDAVAPLELSLALTPNSLIARTMLIFTQYSRGQYGEIGPLMSEGAQMMTDQNCAIHDYTMASYISHVFPSQSSALECEVTSLRAVLDIDPDNLIANERLESMEPCRANLVPFMQKRLKRASLDEKVELQLAIAESTFSEQPQKAFSILCDIVEENSAHLPALRVACNFAEKLNNPTLLCRFLGLQAKNLENIDTRIAALTEAAVIARDRLKQTDRAIEYFKQAFVIVPDNKALCDSLIDLLRTKRDIAAIENIYQMHCRAISREDQVARYVQFADLYIQDYNDIPQAANKLRQSLELMPDSTDIRWKLVQLEVKLQHWPSARDNCETLLELSPDSTDSLFYNVRMTLADIYVSRLSTPDHALPVLQKVLTLQPDDPKAAQELADIYFKDSKLNEALALLLRLKEKSQIQNINILLRIADIYKAIGSTDKLKETIKEATHTILQEPAKLADVQKWLNTCDNMSNLLIFLEDLLKQDSDSLPLETRIDIYKFAVNCYNGPLHMRFEADKYAAAAAVLAPDRFDTQILAASVFDIKEAMLHASIAADISPFSPEPYQAMLTVVVNSSHYDLQARVEQQIEAVTGASGLTANLQEEFKRRIPALPIVLNDAAILSTQTQDRFAHIRTLLKLAGPKAQIFALPEYDLEPLASVPSLLNTVNQIAPCFGIPNPDIRIVHNAPFIYSLCSDEPTTILLNADALSNASEAEIRFHIAVIMTHIKLGTLFITVPPPENLAMLISGLLGLVSEKVASPDVLNRLKSFLPRMARRNVIEFINTAGLQTFQCSAQDIRSETAKFAINIGHLFSADLKASIAALFRLRKPNITSIPTPQQWLINLPNLPYITHLLKYNVSEEYTDLRQHIGLYIHP